MAANDDQQEPDQAANEGNNPPPHNAVGTSPQNAVETGPKKKRSKVFTIILIFLILGGGWFGVTKYLHGLHHEETDDAQIEADILPVIPRVTGYVKEVRVQDNQMVKAGDTLFILDDRDMQIGVAAAEAALATAKANVDASRANSMAAHSGIASSQAGVQTVDAQLQAAQIKLTRAQQDFERYANLIKDHSITQQQYEEVKATRDLAKQQLAILSNQKLEASSQTHVVATKSSAIKESVAVAESMVKQRMADLEKAKLNLSYTIVTAPESGRVSKVNVEEGQLLQAGQTVFNIVHTKNLWIVANFKETQFGNIKPGQSVAVRVDAFPGHDFKAQVSSFSPATGAKFSLLPPDNATGNFVKVVQRIPVKIEFLNTPDSLLSRLRPGMNVNVDVHF